MYLPHSSILEILYLKYIKYIIVIVNQARKKLRIHCSEKKENSIICFLLFGSYIAYMTK